MKKSLPRAMRRAFTLVEVLVAVVILVLVIGAITAVESGNIKTSTSGKFQVQANGLAVGATNIVKQIADKIKLGGTKGASVCDPSQGVAGLDYCQSGVYYLDSSDNLKKCTSCKDLLNCPTGVALQSTKAICANTDAQKLIDGKVFNRTVIIP